MAKRVDRPFDTFVNDPESFWVFFIEFAVFTLVGAVLGIALDLACTLLYAWLAGPGAASEGAPLARLASAAVQVVLNAVVIWALWRLVHQRFVAHFQVTLPGMAFVGMFFGAQWNIVYALQAVLPYPELA